MATTEVQTRPQQQRQLTPMQQLRASLLAAVEKQKDRIAGIIDKRHVLIACEQIEANPKLLECSPASIFRAILKAGFYGWVCDGVLGQGYLVPFKNQATLIAGYKGLRDLVRRSGQADTIMECVHEGDTFTFRGLFEEPEHIKGPGDRTAKPVIGAYVIVYYFASKTKKCFWWPVETIIAHRNRYSIGWKKKGGPNAVDHPWHEKNGAFPVMCMKTILRAVINRGEAPVSLEDRRLVHAPDEEEESEIVDVKAAAPSALLSDKPIVPVMSEGKSEQSAETPPDQPTPQQDPLAAEELQRQSDATEREYITEIIPKIKLEAEAKQLGDEVSARKDLTKDAMDRIMAAAKKQVQDAKGKRGSRSNSGKSLPGVE